MNKRALIFDLDGTLVNTLSDIAFSVNTTLDYFGFPTHTEDDIRKMIGRGSRNLIGNALPADKRSEELIDKALEYYKKYYDKHLVVKTYVYEGLSELLTELKEQGMDLFILSNKDDGQVKEIANTLLPEVFSSINGFSPNFPHKPAPDALNDIIDRFGYSAEDTVLIGDSAVDILTAKNAGVTSVGVTWGFGGKESFGDCCPDFFAEDSSQLRKILKK